MDTRIYKSPSSINVYLKGFHDFLDIIYSSVFWVKCWLKCRKTFSSLLADLFSRLAMSHTTSTNHHHLLLERTHIHTITLWEYIWVKMQICHFTKLHSKNLDTHSSNRTSTAKFFVLRAVKQNYELQEPTESLRNILFCIKEARLQNKMQI